MRRHKISLWVFLLSDAAIFACLLAGYGVARAGDPSWPVPARVFQMGYTWTMTGCLLGGSAAAAFAARRRSRGMLGAGAVAGAIFLAMQCGEWARFIREGATLAANPWGPPPFADWFFVVTGFHGLHVLAGVAWLTIVAARRGASTGAMQLGALYWHFIDGLWLAIFAGFYLL
ncbi:MAG: cytochrome c oxidase subunit 3 [Acidobacteriota bacterium]|nr:cytochrome c oxidase subunit 3 [Acidobacteriota bacterium]